MIAEISVVCATVLSVSWLVLRHLEKTSERVTKEYQKRIEHVEQILARELAA